MARIEMPLSRCTAVWHASTFAGLSLMQIGPNVHHSAAQWETRVFGRLSMAMLLCRPVPSLTGAAVAAMTGWARVTVRVAQGRFQSGTRTCGNSNAAPLQRVQRPERTRSKRIVTIESSYADGSEWICAPATTATPHCCSACVAGANQNADRRQMKGRRAKTEASKLAPAVSRVTCALVPCVRFGKSITWPKLAKTHLALRRRQQSADPAISGEACASVSTSRAASVPSRQLLHPPSQKWVVPTTRHHVSDLECEGADAGDGAVPAARCRRGARLPRRVCRRAVGCRRVSSA